MTNSITKKQTITRNNYMLTCKLVRILVYTFLLYMFTVITNGCTANIPLQGGFSRKDLSLIPASNLSDIHTGTGTKLTGRDFDRVFEICQQVMRENFGGIRSYPADAVITAGPFYFSSGLGALHEQQFRRKARLELRKRSGHLWVYVRVSVDRRDTRTYRQFNPERYGQDYRHSTPMETGENLPWARRQVWNFIRREYARERAIISSITKKLASYKKRPTTH